MSDIKAVDLFCGAGGTSTGIATAARRLGRRLDLLAINHWDVAISTHSANHPQLRHICWPIEQVQPKRVVSGGRLNLLSASPECTHHSIARGGMPVSDQRRAGAWEVCRWATEMRIDSIMVENVREFEQWGPIGQDGRPLQSRRGETFRAWVKALESLNYRVEWRVLNCADYGDPTSRKRLFVLARRGRGKIEWPKPTHGEGRDHPWRTAREIIDWSLRGRSIFDRERPLAPRTIERIAAGLRKFGGPAAEPFLVMLYGTNDARSTARPFPTVTANGQHVGLAQPFILPHLGWTGNNVPQSVDAPMGTVIASHGVGHLVQPFLLPHRHAGTWQGGNAPRSVDQPLPTLTCCSSDIGVVQPFLLHVNHGDGDSRRVMRLDQPVPAVTTNRGMGIVEPFLFSYYGNGGESRVSAPVPTVTTHDRFGLVHPREIDILFRMLTPGELAAAQGFPSDYRFQGSKADQVKQIGNAVPTNTAAALAEAMLAA